MRNFFSFALVKTECEGRITIRYDEFRGLGDRELVECCVMPYRELTKDKEYTFKARAFMKCSPESRAVITFFLFYNQAAISVVKFQYWSIHMILTGMFSELTEGMKYMGNRKMYDYLRGLREIFLSEEFKAMGAELKKDKVKEMYSEFMSGCEENLHAVAEYIRSNCRCFFQFEKVSLGG